MGIQQDAFQRCAARNRREIGNPLGRGDVQLPESAQPAKGGDVTQLVQLIHLQFRQFCIPLKERQISHGHGVEPELPQFAAGFEPGQIDAVQIPAAQMEFLQMLRGEGRKVRRRIAKAVQNRHFERLAPAERRIVRMAAELQLGRVGPCNPCQVVHPAVVRPDHAHFLQPAQVRRLLYVNLRHVQFLEVRHQRQEAQIISCHGSLRSVFVPVPVKLAGVLAVLRVPQIKQHITPLGGLVVSALFVPGFEITEVFPDDGYTADLCKFLFSQAQSHRDGDLIRRGFRNCGFVLCGAPDQEADYGDQRNSGDEKHLRQAALLLRQCGNNTLRNLLGAACGAGNDVAGIDRVFQALRHRRRVHLQRHHVLCA